MLALAVSLGGVGLRIASGQPSPSDVPATGRQETPSVQPPRARQPAPAPRGDSRTTRRTSPFAFGSFLAASRGTTFARTPEMFGDSFYPLTTITATEGLTGGGTMTLTSDLPLAGGGRRTLIAEHNKALPTDRAYFNFNYFHNALAGRASGVSAGGTPPGPFLAARQRSVERYLLGVEKTFGGGIGSLEVRMPLSGQYNFGYGTGAPFENASATGGDVGNLAAILKTVLYRNSATVLSAGLGVDIPTGDDAVAIVGVTRYELENESLNLSPFFAVMHNPNDLFFGHMFAQLDVATHGNSLRFQSLPPDGPAAGVLGKFTDQTLFHLDVGSGCWLVRRPQAPLLSGLAAITEIHYTDTFQKTDTIAASRSTLFFPGAAVLLRNPANWMNVVNFTTGVHCELFDNSTFRVAGAFPLTQYDDRLFDGELLVQFGQRY